MMSSVKSEAPSCCSTTTPTSSSSSSMASAELKLYQAFIFSVPIFFTFVLLLLFYLFYLRRRRVDWDSLRMRANLHHTADDLLRAELGLKKEVREMLPIIVYKESFSVRDTQCPVCLGDYQADDRLQQIPKCGHTFHMECIDHWLVNHTTCPLCRLSLVAPAKVPNELPNNQVGTRQDSPVAETGRETSDQVDSRPDSCRESQSTQPSEPRNEDSETHPNSAEEGETKFESDDQGREVGAETNESGQLDSGPESCGESHSMQPSEPNEDAETVPSSAEVGETKSDSDDQGREVGGERNESKEPDTRGVSAAESQA